MRILSTGWAASLVVLLLAGGGVLAHDIDEKKVNEGDYVTYHVNVRRPSDGVVLFTTDAELAAQEIAGGDSRLLPPKDAPGFYGARAGFLTLSDGSGFDHVPFLLGRKAGDVVRTPPIQLPFEPRAHETLPRVIRGVATTFVLPHENVTNIIAKENASMNELTYLGELKGRAVPINGTHDRIWLRVSPGQTIEKAIGVPVRVLAARASDADLEILLHEGDEFRVTSCAVSLGLDVGRYRVVVANESSLTVEHLDAQDAMAEGPVELEFQILDVNDWPRLYKAQTRVQVALREWKTW